MLISEFKNIEISGVSVALPTQTVPVENFCSVFGEEVVTKFSEMTGVKSVSRAVPDQTASDLAFLASQNLLNQTGIDPAEIGFLLFVTQKPDFRVPSTSFLLHKRLNLGRECACFDINLACSGFIYTLHTGMSLIKNSNAKHGLILTGDTSVRTISPADRTMVMLFGDSGTATLISKTESEQSTWFTFRTDGKRFKSIITPAGAYRNIGAPVESTEWSDGIIRSDYDTHMKGMDVFGFSITDVPLLMKDLMDKLGTTSSSYDYFALHQANMYILKQISRKLKIPLAKIPVALDRYGNNSSNSVPLVLSDFFGNQSNGKYRIMMSGFGAGLSWGVCDAMLDVSTVLSPLFSDEHYQE